MSPEDIDLIERTKENLTKLEDLYERLRHHNGEIGLVLKLPRSIPTHDPSKPVGKQADVRKFNTNSRRRDPSKGRPSSN